MNGKHGARIVDPSQRQAAEFVNLASIFVSIVNTGLTTGGQVKTKTGITLRAVSLLDFENATDEVIADYLKRCWHLSETVDRFLKEKWELVK